MGKRYEFFHPVELTGPGGLVVNVEYRIIYVNQRPDPAVGFAGGVEIESVYVQGVQQAHYVFHGDFQCDQLLDACRQHLVAELENEAAEREEWQRGQREDRRIED